MSSISEKDKFRRKIAAAVINGWVTRHGVLHIPDIEINKCIELTDSVVEKFEKSENEYGDDKLISYEHAVRHVADFLLLNGFQLGARDSSSFGKTAVFSNERCTVLIHNDEGIYEVKSEDGSVFSRNYEIYWLIGYLTYNGLMDKDYKTK